MSTVRWFLFAILAVSTACLLNSCKHDDHNDGDVLPPGLQYVHGDTLYIFPDSAVAFAGARDTPNHFNARAYLYAEFQVASDSFRSPLQYHGNFSEWQQLSWDGRYSHLPAPFTHDIMTDSVASYYFMIGSYLLQFGWGWRDTYNNGSGNVGANPNNPAVNWQQPEAGLTADNPNTIEFDGGSAMFFRYRAMIIRRAR